MQLLHSLIVLCFLFTQKVTSSPQLFSGDHISIDCGSTAASTSLRGRQWLGDFHPKLAPAVEVEGSSTRSSADAESVDRVPYNTARISRSQFSYVFHLNPGQKFIRLHFNPASYNGFHHLDGFFTVEAGPFTLLANFSASIAADALSVKTVVQELCVIIRENEPLKLVFTPSISPSKHACAFINGIEIISVPWSVNYCHGGGIGVQVVGSKSMVYIDNSTSLELVHRQNIKWGSVSSRDDIDITGMFGMWATTLTMWIKGNRVNNMSWRISVDVGFRYLVRIHFCELGLGMVEAGRKDFMLVINQVIVSTSGDLLQERGNQSTLFYKNYMVIVEGHKRDIFISLQSDHVFLDRNGPLEGFEVFKLNNHDYNLASPNPLPPKRDSPLQPIQILLSLVGRRNALATVVFAAICLVNIIVCMLQQTSVSSFTEEEDSMPSSTRAKRLCRRFTLAEIQAATDNFYDAFVIGKGGFGKVYKGLIDNGRDTVAIKRLKPDSKQGKREFWTEIETLSELRHVNLVSLIGYCNEQPEMILVYEYMPCGTLADHLYKLARKNNAHHPLSWKQRLQICIGAGRGLDYLHTGLENEIVHRDVKASNILLDEKFVAKVSDFGLAKIKSGSKSQNEASTNLKGTFGYIDPDFFRTHRLTIASDTYSFGVVLLQVLCGRPAVEPWAEVDKRSLTMWARDNISKGQVDHIIDPSLREEISADSLKTFVRIAEKCLIDEPKKRPAIAHVVMKLQFALERHDQTESLVAKERVGIADIFPSADRSQNENTNSLVPNERTNVADVLPHEIPHEITNVADVAAHADKFQHEKSKSLFPDKDILSGDDRTILSISTGPTPASSNVENATKEQINSNMISSGKIDERKSVMHKLSRKLWPWDALWKTGKTSKKKDVVSHALSAPILRRTSYMGLKEIDSDLANQNSNNQAFSREYWRLLQCQNGLRIFEELLEVDFLPKRCSRAMRAVGVVEASCVEIFEQLMCMDATRYEWDCSFQYGSLVEEVDGHTAILYHRLQLDWFPQFAWPRDLCYVRYWRRNDDGSYVVLFCSREHENCGPQPGFVRAHIESGGFNISPLKPRNGRPRTQVQHLMQIDLKGWGVGYISSFQQHCLLQMLNCVAGLREYYSQTDERTVAPRIPVMVKRTAIEEEPTEKLDLSIFSGNLRRDGHDKARNCWTLSDGSNFRVRSKRFCYDKSKIPAGKHLMDLIAVDWFKDTKRMDHVARRAGCAAQVASDKGHFSIVFNLQVPGSTHYSMVFYFVGKEPVPGSLLQQFVDGDDEFRNSRLKLIPSVPKGSWIVCQSVGSTPCLLGKAVDCNYIRAPKYLEIDVDIGSSTVANGVLGLVVGVITTVVVDMAFLVQANSTDELPERLIGAVRVSHIELSSAIVPVLESDSSDSLKS